MISFDTNIGLRFNLRAAAIIRCERGVIMHRFEKDTYWSLPGGRVDAGETAGTTVVREMNEEAGEQVKCGKLAWLIENFCSYRERRYHEMGLYFEVELRPNSRFLHSEGPFFGVEGNHTLEFDWFDAERLSSTLIRPPVIVPELISAGANELPFKHMVNIDA